LLIVVDYAHSPDALEKVLVTLRETATVRGGKLMCVFGCGGDRDIGKRPQMGSIAERLADAVVLTSDNPRSENPQAIIAAIQAGMQATPTIETDRALAIAQVVAQADAHDVILIAGKGHEPYQEIAGIRLPFSDIESGKSALAGRRQAC
jgi:UDP-N-acetylmuramoyl-L-alanyl-D-glutamate--2,6-diaminopimelate ligase